MSGPQQRVYRSEAIDIGPRTAVPLEERVPAEGTIVNFGDSMLYSFGSERAIVEIASAPVGNSDDPWLLVTGPEGSLYAEAIGFAEVVGATAEGGMYIVVTDSSGFSADLDFSVVARSAPLGTAFATETSDPHDTIATAQPVVPPVTVEGGALDLLGPAGGNEEDWYRITIGPDDADRSLALSTSDASDDSADTRIRVLSEDGEVLSDQDTEGSPLFTYHETVFVPPLGEGTFYVIVSAAGPEYPWPMLYNLALAFEAP